MDIKKNIMDLLKKKTYGLTIEDVSQILDINKATASKYLFALEAERVIVARPVGKAKLHYLKSKFGG